MTATMTMPPLAAPSSAPDHVSVRLRLIGQMEAWTITSESVLPPGRKNSRPARDRGPLLAAASAALAAGRDAVEPAAGGTGPRLAAPGDPSPARQPLARPGGRDRRHPRPPRAARRRGLGRRRGGAAGDPEQSGVAVAAGRGIARRPGRRRSRLRTRGSRSSASGCAIGRAASPNCCCASSRSLRRRSRRRSRCWRSTAPMRARGGR